MSPQIQSQNAEHVLSETVREEAQRMKLATISGFDRVAVGCFLFGLPPLLLILVYLMKFSGSGCVWLVRRVF